MTRKITRRSFLKEGSLVITVTALSGKLSLVNITAAQAQEAATFHPHAFLEIARDDTVTVWIGQTNLGQGTHTGISMIVADELDADWNKVEARMAPAGEAFKDPLWHMQFTGGSTSIRHRWELLHKVGAAARQMLIEVAAKRWQVKAETCSTAESRVSIPDGRSFRYGELVVDAAGLPVPENPPLKDPKNYRIIGTKRARLDIPAKVEGKAVFGIDIQVPNMCVATVMRPPFFGARPESFDSAAAMAVPGVLEVIPLEDKIAVCAEHTYAALQGREKLNIKWTGTPHHDVDDAKLDGVFAAYLKHKGAVAQDSGDVKKALSRCINKLAASYRVPFVAHSALEPINCTAHVEKDRCRVWVPTQGQTVAQKVAADISGLPLEKVEVMTPFVGGGFGLRGEPDPVIDAVSLSRQMSRPVKVLWRREDDFAHDYFRPGAISRIKAGMDARCRVIGWHQKVVSPSIMARAMPEEAAKGVDQMAVQGITDMVYDIPNRRVEYVMLDLPIPVGFWRSVGYSINIFTVETMMDELAHTAQRDPLQFRLDHLKKGSRAYRTLELLAEKSGWSAPPPKGRGRGIAVGACFGSAAAHMAEVSVDRYSGKVRVHRVVCAIDCGPSVYPDAIAAQMEGGVVMALSLAFHEKVSFAAGSVATANYDSYRLLTMSEVPEVEVHVAESKHDVGGVGELGIPTVAPAVANAIFAATGTRLRELPFGVDKLKRAAG